MENGSHEWRICSGKSAGHGHNAGWRVWHTLLSLPFLLALRRQCHLFENRPAICATLGQLRPLAV
ncbi:protein of unknown function [Acidithiobacillus ferrivorans]|uniref:Uncharacterized protein n=1 Tax=Acidithiobacillus ferrivorans TaxID=160808 RepID=A0ABY1MR82_9PROT|nr:protein of unknown function [Acidithiobacillus ferrivorans]